MKLQKYVKGFTLIELLVVIAIIGVLSTLAVVSLNSARQKSRDTSRVANIKQIQNGLEMYFNDNNTYPIKAKDVLTGAINAGTQTYMQAVPLAPTPADTTDCDASIAVTSGNVTANDYIYESTDSAGATCSATSCPSYKIQFCVGSKTGNVEAGVNCATPAGIKKQSCW